MLEILGLLGGAFTRLAPMVLDLFKTNSERKHEAAMLEKQVALEELRAKNAQAEIAATAAGKVDTTWAESLAAAMANAVPPPLSDTGKWYLNVLNAMNVSVRPVLTYWWCIVTYTAAKIVTIVVAIQANASLAAFDKIILTEFDRAVVGSIIGFWFVDRALRGREGK